jgi:hypothetical protein
MMHKFILLVFIAITAVSCAGLEDVFEVEGGFVLPQSHANVIREFSFFSEESEGIAEGFDLDGVNSEEPVEDSCYTIDRVDSEGRTGIDNQLAYIWTDLEGLVGEAANGLVQGAINEGRFLIMIELEGVDDLQNDDDVTVHILRGIADPDIGTKGLISPDQTFYADESASSSSVKNAQIIDGKLEAGPVEFIVPINILDADFGMQVRSGKVRIDIQPDGSFEGLLGGFIKPAEFIADLMDTGARAEAQLIGPFFEDNTDHNRVDGDCTDFSAAFNFSGTTAFVVRENYPD